MLVVLGNDSTSLPLRKQLGHVIPEGVVSVAYPLAPRVAALLREDSLQGEDSYGNSEGDTISRSALSSILEKGDLLSELASRIVVRVAPDIVVKTGSGNDATELMMLNHIRTASVSIPVPEPLGLLAIGSKSYMFSSFIEGITLDRIWQNLAVALKENLRGQLTSIFADLRRLPSPSKAGFLGCGEPPFCKDTRRWTRNSNSRLRNEDDFNDFLLTDTHSTPSHIAFVRSSLRTDHRIVMTHGDLHPRNIIVNNENDVEITGVIDWEKGGAYPDYWEYIKALNTSDWTQKDDWHLYLPVEGIGEYRNEYAKDYIIGRMVG